MSKLLRNKKAFEFSRTKSASYMRLKTTRASHVSTVDVRPPSPSPSRPGAKLMGQHRRLERVTETKWLGEILQSMTSKASTCRSLPRSIIVAAGTGLASCCLTDRIVDAGERNRQARQSAKNRNFYRHRSQNHLCHAEASEYLGETWSIAGGHVMDQFTEMRTARPWMMIKVDVGLAARGQFIFDPPRKN